MSFNRYALYWTPPPDSELETFGRGWLGAATDDYSLPFLQKNSVLEPALIERATASPRRYGLHATMKAPFHLADRADEAALSAALATFCARRSQIRTGPLRLHRFTRYLALVPENDRADLEWLADECVTYFDSFRVPLDEADRARRAGSLSPVEQSFFEQFGYPHIFSSFFFHITLAGPLSEDELTQVETALQPIVAPLCEESFVLDALSLCGDPGGGAPFECVSRYPLLK